MRDASPADQAGKKPGAEDQTAEPPKEKRFADVVAVIKGLRSAWGLRIVHQHFSPGGLVQGCRIVHEEGEFRQSTIDGERQRKEDARRSEPRLISL